MKRSSVQHHMLPRCIHASFPILHRNPFMRREPTSSTSLKTLEQELPTMLVPMIPSSCTAPWSILGNLPVVFELSRSSCDPNGFPMPYCKADCQKYDQDCQTHQNGFFDASITCGDSPVEQFCYLGIKPIGSAGIALAAPVVFAFLAVLSVM